MEEKIERFIDKGLENIAPFLYIFSIVGGILLIILGVIMIVKNKTTSNNKSKKMSVLSIGIGIVALFSGFIQYVF